METNMQTHSVIVLVNHTQVTFQHLEQTGRSIKEHAHIPPEHTLCVDDGTECGCEQRIEELTIVRDDEPVHLDKEQHFWSIAPTAHGVTVAINDEPYEFRNPHQTGRSLKARAGIPATDVLFLDRPGEDEVIPDDAQIVLKCDDHFHSSPPANYGDGPPVGATDVGCVPFQALKQPDGWTYLLVPNYQLPVGFLPRVIQLLIKLPPLFPDAAPDMFWVSPHVRLEAGAAPQGTSIEAVMGSNWQRFSWHLQPGAWRPGISTLRDYMRCVRARFAKRN
jgi:Prokaryotic E2 family E